MSQQTRHPEYTDTRTTDVHTELRPPARRRPRLELSGPKVLAGALAAASAAVAASWLGVAGTVLGAVIASVVVSITTALYSHPLERSTQVIREVLPQRVDGMRGAYDSTSDTRVYEAVDDVELQAGDGDGDQLSSRLVEVDPRGPSRRRISWATVAVSSVLTLMAGLGILTVVETVIGQSASSLTGSHGGSTTVGNVFDRGSSSDGDNTGDNQPNNPTPGDPTPDEPSDTPNTDDPTTPEPTEPTPTDPTPTEPTPTDPTTPQPTDGTSPDDGSADAGGSADQGADAGAGSDGSGTTPE